MMMTGSGFKSAQRRMRQSWIAGLKLKNACNALRELAT
jgi:hypothetical protein